jgi:lipopolysaccharide export LptBFGC system permease protein LptF
MGPVILSLSILFMDEFIFTGMSQNSDISSSNRQEYSSQSASWQYKDDTLIGLKKLNNRDAEAIQIIEFDQQGNLKESRKFKQGVLMNDQLIVGDLNDPEGSLKDFSFRSAPKLSSMSIDTLSLRSLFQLQKSYHTLNSSDDLRLIRSSIYAKIFLPLSIIAVIFLAGSLMFGMIRSGGVGKQIVIGVFIGLVYDLTKDLSIASFLTYKWPILWAHLLPIILVILASLVSYKRI